MARKKGIKEKSISKTRRNLGCLHMDAKAIGTRASACDMSSLKIDQFFIAIMRRS
jgi:hypothetical protein